MDSITVGAKVGAKGASVCQAKVIRADGKVEYHYSIPKMPWWRRAQRKFVRDAMARHISEENQ